MTGVTASSPSGAPLTVVFLHAHPDDEASQTAGTQRLLADAGHRVVVVYATNGDHGVAPEDLAPGETVVDRRRAEAEASAEVTGTQAVHWLGYADSGMTGWEQNAHETSFHSADPSAAAVRLAAEITPIVCATTLEAQVRELRLIAAHKPRYNRRSRHPERAWWLKLTDEVFPRLSIVRSVGPDDLAFAGPFGTRGTAEEAMAALHDAVPLRQCLTRLSPRRPTSACALADMGRCSAPCTGEVPVEDYAVTVAEAAQAASARACRPVVYWPASSTPPGWPRSTMSERRSVPGLSSTGFIAELGCTRAAAACRYCARPISEPSAHTMELLLMFCALNGTTSIP